MREESQSELPAGVLGDSGQMRAAALRRLLRGRPDAPSAGRALPTAGPRLPFAVSKLGSQLPRLCPFKSLLQIF